MARWLRLCVDGLPALRFAVIRGFWSFAFWNWALNPHASARAAILHQSLALKAHSSFCLDLCQFSPSQLCLPLCIRQRRRRATRQESRAGTVAVDRTAASYGFCRGSQLRCVSLAS